MSDSTSAGLTPPTTTTQPPAPRSASAPAATPTTTAAPRPAAQAGSVPLVSPQVAQQIADMTAAVSQQVLTAPPNKEYPWIKPVVAILSMLLLALLTAYAFWSNDPTLRAVVATTIVLMAKNSQTYYFGSSSGSARKTDLLAASPAVSQGPTP